MMPWVLRVILTLKGAMCGVFRRNVIHCHLYDAKGWEQARPSV